MRKNLNGKAIEKVPLDVLVSTLTKPSRVVLKRDPHMLLNGQNTNRDQSNSTKVESKEKEKVSAQAEEEQHKNGDEKNNPKLNNGKQHIVHHYTWKEGDIVWAKMRGFPLWPAKV